jgi:hypothetical protein
LKKIDDQENLVPPVVFPISNPPVVSQFSPEFENKARNDLGAQLIHNTKENENLNVACDNVVATLLTTNETTDFLLPQLMK